MGYPNVTVTYGTLMTSTLNTILSLVQNADSTTADHYSSNVPAEFKPGYRNTVSFKRPGYSGQNQNLLKYMYYYMDRVADTHLATTTAATITSEFNAFMSARGVTANSSKVVNTRGLINFYNNVASFISKKLILVTSQLNSAEVIFYDPVVYDPSEYPSVTTYDGSSTDAISGQDVNEVLTTLRDTINNVSRVEIVRYAISYTSSSCSSSSSSSSSSCSCSSSSSVFIGWWKI